MGKSPEWTSHRVGGITEMGESLGWAGYSDWWVIGMGGSKG